MEALHEPEGRLSSRPLFRRLEGRRSEFMGAMRDRNSGWFHPVAERSFRRNSLLSCGSVRQAKFGCSSWLKVSIMVKGRKPCSAVGGWREQSCGSKPGWTNARAVAARELGSASLHEKGSGQSPGYDEARIRLEAPIKRKGGTPRGERRQRVRTEQSGTWEARRRALTARLGRLSGGSHNSGRGGVAASGGAFHSLALKKDGTVAA